MLTRQEKEKLAVELYNQGKTIRDIGLILKKASGEIEENQDKGQSSLLSLSTQAYQLFSKRKNLIEVAISLNLGELETTKYY